MNCYDWQVCTALALVVLERFAEAVGDGLVGDGNGYSFIQAAADEINLFESDRSGYERARQAMVPRKTDPSTYILGLWMRGTWRGRYKVEHVLECIIEELMERTVLALGGDE